MKFHYCPFCLRELPEGHTRGDVIKSRFRRETDFRRHLFEEHTIDELVYEVADGSEPRASPPDWYYNQEHTYQEWDTEAEA